MGGRRGIRGKQVITGTEKDLRDGESGDDTPIVNNTPTANTNTE